MFAPKGYGPTLLRQRCPRNLFKVISNLLRLENDTARYISALQFDYRISSDQNHGVLAANFKQLVPRLTLMVIYNPSVMHCRSCAISSWSISSGGTPRI